MFHTKKLHGFFALFAITLIGVVLIASPPPPRSFLVYGPENFTRAAGQPVIETRTFSVSRPGADYQLRIYNGGNRNQFVRSSNAHVKLNDRWVAVPADFSTQTPLIERRVTLAETNTLYVKLSSDAGSGITIEISGLDGESPTITASAQPTPNAAGWTNTNVVVTFICADSISGIASCPSPVTVANDGANQIITGVATDRAGNTASTSITVNHDHTAPIVSITSPAAGSTVSTPQVQVSINASDALSGIAAVSCNGQPATVNGSSFACNVNLQTGANNIQAQATDRAGNTATSSISVTLATANSSPTLTNLNAPSTVVFGQGASVRFNYADPDADIVAVETTRTNALGQLSASIPAESASINGASGMVTLQLEPAEFAFGENSFSVQLRDSRNQTSNLGSFNVSVRGESSGGNAPALTNFNSTAAQWNRPTRSADRLRAAFSFSYNDVDADILLARLRITRPNSQPSITEESAASLGINNASGTVSPHFLTLSPNDPLGTYQVELTLIDRNGNASNTSSASFELVENGGTPATTITNFSPQQGGAGTTVTVTGAGFTGNDAVSLGSINAEVTASTPISLTVVIPTGASSGRFVVRNQNGVAASDASFTVPTSISVSPSVTSVVVDGWLQFATEVVSANQTDVSWSVNGIAGGNSTVGEINAQGLYRAPSNIPVGTPITVTAALNSNPSIVGTAAVSILPPPAVAGSATVLAATGGVVRSTDGRANVSIPPQALPNNTEVTIAPLYGRQLPPSLPERRVVGAVRFGPSPLSFSSPVTITVPLTRYYRPTTQLTLRYFDEQTNNYTSEQLVATVNETGEQATASVNHFSTYVVDDSETLSSVQAVCQSAITIQSFTTGGFPFQEGMNVPVRFLGSGFTADLRVRMIANNGGRDDDIIPGALYTLGGTAGVLLDIQTIRDLGANETRAYTLRMERPGSNCQFAEVPIEVQGLHEFDERNPAPGRYSEITIRGNFVIPPDGLNLEATGPVNIFGNVDGIGAHGANANGQNCGGLQPGESGERCGLNGQPGDGRGGLGRQDDDDEPFYFGNGGDTSSFRHTEGGRPGAQIDGSAIATALGLEVASNFGCFAGDLSLCPVLAARVVGVANGIEEITNPHYGQSGEGVIRVGSFRVGGGGGGGGFISSPPLPIPGPYAGSSLKLLGGGGGGGGRSGRSFRITATGQIFVTGLIITSGGDGGDGSNMSTLALDAPIFLPTIHIPVSVPSFSGGGGGGGTGGTIALVSADTLAFSRTSEQAISRGGIGGHGGQEGLLLPDNQRSHGEPGARILEDSQVSDFSRVFDATTIDNSVTNRSAINVRVASPRIVPLTIRVEGENQTREFTTLIGNQSHTANILLFQGFNTVCVNIEPGQSCGTTPLLEKRVLSVFLDTDGDGVSDAEEISVGTNPNSNDTDNDGLLDGEEFVRGTNPLDPDCDDDGLLDGEEVAHNTNVFDSDTDDDTFIDGYEFLLASDPLSATSIPNMIPNGTMLGQSRNELLAMRRDTGFFGVLGPVTINFRFGMAFDENGTLYLADMDRLRIFAPFTNVDTPVGSFGAPGGTPLQVAQVAYNPVDHRLYGLELLQFLTSPGQLVQIDEITGAGVRVGTGAGVPLHAITFRRDGVLFATAPFDATTDRFLELDPATGTIRRDLGPVGFANVDGLSFDLNGTLFASQSITGTQSRILTIDPVTGAGTGGPFVARGDVLHLATMPCAAPCFDRLPAVNLPFAASETHVADLNNDSNPDIVTGNGQVLMGDGTGHFTPNATSIALMFGPSALADLDLDGDIDIIVANRSTPPQTFRVYLNDGVANFTQVGGTYTIDGDNSLTVIEIGDLTGDGVPDIAARGTLANAPVAFVLRGLGGGRFDTPQAIVNGGAFGRDFVLADMNADGALDFVAVANTGVYIHLNNGTGTFTATQVSTYSRGQAVAVGDLNGDGAKDIAMAGGETSSAAVLLNNANGTFAPVTSYNASPNQLAFIGGIALDELTGDGNLDLVTANTRNIAVLNDNRIGRFRIGLRAPFSVFNNSALHVTTGDVDRNGWPDVIISNGVSITILLNHDPWSN